MEKNQDSNCKRGEGGIYGQGLTGKGHEKLLEVTVLFSMLAEVCITGICKRQKEWYA